MKDLESTHKQLNKSLICQKCGDAFYAHGASKYCVICKPLMMDLQKRDRNKRMRERKRIIKGMVQKPIEQAPLELYVKRPRAKSIY